MNETTKVRWAILGAGSIAHKFANDFLFTNNAELYAVASRDKIRAAAFADKYHIANTCSYDELYNNTDVDAVYIATPHNFHFEQTLSCLKSGKAVLCEKPITINDKEMKLLAKAAEESGSFLMEGIWTYFLPSVIKAKEWLETGRIGKLHIIQANFCFERSMDNRDRLFNPELAGGALLDIGIYLVAFAYFFMKEKPEQIRSSALFTPSGVDATTSILLRFKEVTAVLLTSLVTRTINNGFLYGDKGYIKLPEFYRATAVHLYDTDNHLLETFEDNRSGFGYQYQIQEVTDRVLKGHFQSPVVPLRASVEIQEIMTEVRRQIGLVYPME